MASIKRFEDKTAFITGAASGIGRATAVAYAGEGARVVVMDRDKATLQETAEHVKAAGAEVLAITCDVSKPEEVEAAVAQAVKTFGRIDCAFNNAGVENKAAPLHQIELQEWDRILNINLRGAFVCMKHEIAQMVRQGGGVVVNTSSGAGIRGVVRIPLILISHSGRSRSPLPVILITLFTLPEEGTVDGMTWCQVAATDG